MITSALGRALDTVLDRTVAPGYLRTGLAVRRALPGWPADPAPEALAGTHVVVTGASSGLGTATARGLTRLGATVHLVVRDEEKGSDVAVRLTREVAGAHLVVHRCDVADLDDVRRFAATDLPDLHAIVHNAGVMPATRTLTPQGHEQSMAVHVLGPVLMTELLRDRLTPAGRVILVSSGGMYAQGLRADDPEYAKGRYTPTSAYARSKRMQVELTPLLAERWSTDGPVLATMHPGWADTPGVQESLPRFHQLTGRLLRDDAEGADTSIWLTATEPAPTSGLFWHDRRPRPTHLLPLTRPSAESVQAAWQWLGESLDLSA